jgi:hypothetical protein
MGASFGTMLRFWSMIGNNAPRLEHIGKQRSVSGASRQKRSVWLSLHLRSCALNYRYAFVIKKMKMNLHS